MIYLGCAGWGLSREHAQAFTAQGTQLQRYAAVFSGVEINSSFYRPHRPATYARWGVAVPAGFRFAVKVPREITHDRRLVDCEAALESFVGQCEMLGERLGCLLVQLPPSLVFEPPVAERFLRELRQRFDGPVAIEPRHASWAAAQGLLVQMRVAQVAVDPPRFGIDAEPRGWPGLVYWRLHGSPRIYFSDYSQAWLEGLAEKLREQAQGGVAVWCVFDNTAAGAAVGNALVVREVLGR